MTFHDFVYAGQWFFFGYFVLLNGGYLALNLLAMLALPRHMEAQLFDTLPRRYSGFEPPVSILVPAYNEEKTIGASLRSMLQLDYPEFEVIAVNDGSRDRTLQALIEEFALVPYPEAYCRSVETKAVRGIYRSTQFPNLRVIDKENGGKADALNAGINAASHPYFCAVDADAILEDDSLLRIVKPVIDDPDGLVAAAGIIRIANGATISGGRMLDFRLPRSRLATMQVVEYFRAFLVGRIGWDSLGALLVVSGAFGLFRRSAVEEVGGYALGTVGEDIELVVRLQARLRERHAKFRIAFVPEPTCWTEAPEDLKTLSTQRRRWQRGLGETLWRHRRLMGNPRYGAVGLLALPYFLVAEFLGSVIEVFGIFVVVAAVATGAVTVSALLAYTAVSMLIWILLSFSAILLEEYAIRRYVHGRDIAKMVLYSLSESIGYRQLNAFWRCQAMVDLARRRKGWGTMPRRGLERPTEAPPGRMTRV